MSYKNILQEYCQKNKIQLPRYISQSIGLQHQLDWYTTIEFPSKNISIRTPTPSVSKILAEQSAAELLVKKLRINPDSEPEIIVPLKHPTLRVLKLYIIDLENKPCFNKEPESNQIYIGFNHALHHSIQKYSHWHLASTADIEAELARSKNNKLLYLINGGVSNLVDHFMTMFVWPITVFVSKNPVEIIYIVSGDMASFCTKICLEKAIEFSGVDDIGVQIENISVI